MILVSIIIPVFNADKYLSRCIDSLLNQTFEKIEVIAINDGSEDESGKILDLYAEKYPDKIRVIHQENQGISKARNLGLQLAKGKAVAFIDSDDYVSTEYCQSLFEELDNEELDVVVCDYYEVNEDGTSKKYIHIPTFPDSSVFDRAQILFEVNTSPWNKMYRKAYLEQNNICFPEEVKYEDILFIHSVMKNGARMRKIDRPLLYYYVHEGSQTTVMKKSVFDIFIILDRVTKMYMDTQSENISDIYKYLEWFVINRITVYNFQQIYQGDINVAMSFIETGFSYLNSNFPRWRKNAMFLSNNGRLKRIIKRSKLLTKLSVYLAKRSGKKWLL